MNCVGVWCAFPGSQLDSLTRLGLFFQVNSTLLSSLPHCMCSVDIVPIQVLSHWPNFFGNGAVTGPKGQEAFLDSENDVKGILLDSEDDARDHELGCSKDCSSMLYF